MRFAAPLLPLAAALGGMLVPALIFLGLNVGRPSAVGWAVPMATDIAFAVGALALLGKRVTPALRILLLALAVIDDVGAIVVIALFYSTDIAAMGFAVLGLGILATITMQLFGVRSPLAYFVPCDCCLLHLLPLVDSGRGSWPRAFFLVGPDLAAYDAAPQTTAPSHGPHTAQAACG